MNIDFCRYGHGKGTEHGGFSEYSVLKGKYCYVLQHGISPLQVLYSSFTIRTGKMSWHLSLIYEKCTLSYHRWACGEFKKFFHSLIKMFMEIIYKKSLEEDNFLCN
jgi:hypothetical protein